MKLNPLLCLNERNRSAVPNGRGADTTRAELVLID